MPRQTNVQKAVSKWLQLSTRRTSETRNRGLGDKRVDDAVDHTRHSAECILA